MSGCAPTDGTLQPSVDNAATHVTSSTCWLREPESNDIDDIVAWLAQPTISRWFDFGLGRQALPALAVQAMVHSRQHRIRVFGSAGYPVSSGVVAVSDVTHRFATGSFWILRDRLRPACVNMAYNAATYLLHEAFVRDRLRCITAWAVDCNVPSQRLLARLGFRLIGLQRDCHLVDGTRVGRLLYDLLPEDLVLPRAP
ncbi:TPA: GNAT family N-acetyltransferase [Burkholderia aenigmatica]|uniref:GNAT family N-acetyltransferase n=1 Tax=Burkholderia sp. AU45251 TaxID=3059204 RepID=UPI00264DE863|nr:GNAT family protein [Burkholderia sp. AU45251]HDR9483135.1 GNAT family N-acetyltransferase [Burkholderia aenigmatica]MDN7515999.1 GNAT family protein [Burkholderia sp. AU45251]HDR9514083.1 GNAT family N-acetyltransferase [Burkholderia aenigmatica]HDR9591473.1 GNAT family N-acetyltransferase [Burkholderia aenigmatica]HDR9598565.1 GNAT family N-acetyltransferase [Burkholderia aenigmatica]